MINKKLESIRDTKSDFVRSAKISFIVSAILLMFLSSCGSDDGVSSPFGNQACFVEDFSLAETEVEDYKLSNSVSVYFDVRNWSEDDFAIAEGDARIDYTMWVTTKDGTTYETTDLFPILTLSSGALTTTFASGDYGAGKEYSHYHLELHCR